MLTHRTLLLACKKTAISFIEVVLNIKICSITTETLYVFLIEVYKSKKY